MQESKQEVTKVVSLLVKRKGNLPGASNKIKVALGNNKYLKEQSRFHRDSSYDSIVVYRSAYYS